MSIECALFGTLTADPKSRTSAAGKPRVSINLRVGHGEKTQWVTVAVFGDDAAAIAKLKEGGRVYVEGRIELHRWEKHDGSKMSGLSVTAFFCRVAEIGRAKPRPSHVEAR